MFQHLFFVRLWRHTSEEKIISYNGYKKNVRLENETLSELTQLCGFDFYYVNEGQADCVMLLFSNALRHTLTSHFRAAHVWEGLFTVGNCADLRGSWDLLPCSRAYRLWLLRGRLFLHFLDPNYKCPDHLLSLRSNYVNVIKCEMLSGIF